MDASVVLGQAGFTTSSSGTSQGKFSALIRGIFVDPQGRLLVSDTGNHRVLIWNQIPTTNNALPDLVLGQADFNSVTSNRGGLMAANTFDAPRGLFSDGTRLFVVDNGSDRVLVWNTFPTQNGQGADMAIGAPDLVTNPADTCVASKFNDPQAVTVYGNKVLVADRSYQRVLVWNSIPTQSGTDADVAVGQPDLTTCTTGTLSARSLSDPRGVQVDSQGRLIVADRGRQRILIWNSIPTASNADANVVVGQPDFVTSGGAVAANRFSSLFGMFSNGDRLFVPDATTRVLIFNQVPGSNGLSADIVLGQTNFTNSSANGGGSVSATGFNTPDYLHEYQNKLFVVDETNSRVLIFNNLLKQPGISLNNSPEGRDNNQIRLGGTASVDNPYVLKSVEFSINGSSFSGSNPTDGSFDETSEDFYFDFNPTSNQPKDSNGNLIDGYTVRIRSTNNNADVTDRLFYFTPFDLLGPSDNATVSTAYPTFSFAVNRQRINLRDNLAKYQVQVRSGGSSSTASWQTVIDDIPVDFSTVQKSDLNLQKNMYLNRDSNNGDGVYETTKLTAIYSVDSSRVQVTSKISPLSGTYQWKIVAADKAGHNQEAGARNLFVNATSTSTANNFPLAVLNISGLGNPHINSYNPGGVKSIYYTSSTNPIFFGIAWTNSKVTLKLTDQSCKTECTKTYSSIANVSSRFGINVPKGDLKLGKNYSVNMSVALNDKYNELPQFTLTTSSISSGSKPTSPVLGESASSLPESPQSTPIPHIVSQKDEAPQQPDAPKKKCILFFCF